MTTSADLHAADRKLLSETPQFQQLPGRVQYWVTESPLASAQFAQFFRDGGEIRSDPNQTLAAYFEQDAEISLPSIHVRSIYYPLVNFEGKDTILQEGALFATLAHEIGHHVINSHAHQFIGITQEANVQYRAEHEAMAVLNAFKIFDELRERDPTYLPRYGSVGYGSDAEVAGIYLSWREHRDDRVVIQQLSHIVQTMEDSRTKQGLDNVPDYNHDGKVTHGERFMRDWDESEKRKRSGPATKTNDSDETRPESERTQRHQGGIQSPPPGASTRELFEHMCAAMETGDDRVLKQAIATVADAPGNREFWAHISASVDADQREAALQAQVREQAQQMQQMQMERQGPVMSLGYPR